jgi:hypothetical protein
VSFKASQEVAGGGEEAGGGKIRRGRMRAWSKVKPTKAQAEVRRVFKVGGSLAIVLTPSWCAKHNIQPRDELLIVENTNEIQLKPIKEVTKAGRIKCEGE